MQPQESNSVPDQGVGNTVPVTAQAPEAKALAKKVISEERQSAFMVAAMLGIALVAGPFWGYVVMIVLIGMLYNGFTGKNFVLALVKLGLKIIEKIAPAPKAPGVMTAAPVASVSTGVPSPAEAPVSFTETPATPAAVVTPPNQSVEDPR